MRLRVAVTSLMPFCLDASILLLLLVGGAESGPEEEYINNIRNSFPTMSREELLETWHTGCHRRCNQQLYAHVETACENDPYRVGTQQKRPDPFLHEGSSNEKKDSPFLPREVATVFLHKRSGSGRSPIMEECCFRKDCAWEEYAEYCHGHNRRRNERVSNCS